MADPWPFGDGPVWPFMVALLLCFLAVTFAVYMYGRNRRERKGAHDIRLGELARLQNPEHDELKAARGAVYNPPGEVPRKPDGSMVVRRQSPPSANAPPAATATADAVAPPAMPAGVQSQHSSYMEMGGMLPAVVATPPQTIIHTPLMHAHAHAHGLPRSPLLAPPGMPLAAAVDAPAQPQPAVPPMSDFEQPLSCHPMLLRGRGVADAGTPDPRSESTRTGGGADASRAEIDVELDHALGAPQPAHPDFAAATLSGGSATPGPQAQEDMFVVYDAADLSTSPRVTSPVASHSPSPFTSPQILTQSSPRGPARAAGSAAALRSARGGASAQRPPSPPTRRPQGGASVNANANPMPSYV